VITFSQLEYIVAVDTYRHYVTAAEKVFVTQPTLSMQIKKLEENLGVLIFDRSKQPIVPTSVGEKIIAQARIVLREREKIGLVISDFQGKVSGDLKVGIIPTLAPHLVPRFVGDFIRAYPEVNLQIRELKTDEMLVQIQKDLIDVGILVTPLESENLKEIPLFYEELKLYLTENHTCIQKFEVDFKDIDLSEIWLMDEGHCFRNQVYNFCKLHTISNSQLPFRYESGSLEMLRKLVDTEGGFTLLPELATLNLNTFEQKQVKNLKGIVPLREVSLVYGRSFVKEKLLHLLENQIKNSVPEPMLDRYRGVVVEWQN